MAKNGQSKSSTKVERTNTGKSGGRKNPQTHADLIRMGKGRVKSIKPVDCSPWQGVSTVTVPFDSVQAAKNKAAGYC